jgi:hypothetical protein
MSMQWITVYDENGFDEAAIEKAANAAGRAPDHLEDPFFIDDVRVPRAIEFDIENDDGEQILLALAEAGFDATLDTAD